MSSVSKIRPISQMRTAPAASRLEDGMGKNVQGVDRFSKLTRPRGLLARGMLLRDGACKADREHHRNGRQVVPSAACSRARLSGLRFIDEADLDA